MKARIHEHRFVAPQSIITMRHVAEAVGVATSTVSKALRHDPTIPEARCREIRAAAEKLGYRPNPAVATLMAQLHHHRRRSDPHSIAWIDLWGAERSEVAKILEPMLHGARERANSLGYGIEVYRAGAEQISPGRLRQMLTSRGQWGLIIPPVPQSARRFPFDLRGFAGVAIGTSLQEPVMYRVAPNHFRGCVLAFERLRERGLRRIGLALSPEMNERVEGKWLGAFLFCQQRLPAEQRVTPLIALPETHEAFARWLQQAKPGAVLVAEEAVVRLLQGANNRSDQAPMIGWLLRTAPNPGDRSLDERHERMGSVAVETVVAQIHRNERGSPSVPYETLIDPVWVE
jgi:LacI family transcriptional regulator